MPQAARHLVSALIALTLAPGCAAPQRRPPIDPAGDLRARTGASARFDGALTPGIPKGIGTDDGMLTADEAVATALWNNATFQVSIAELGFARADLLDAGLLTNPVLSLLFPLGPKQFEATLRWPVEVLWQRPRRVAAAQLASHAAAERLVQTGLDLVLAVRVAYADLRLATDRARLAAEVSGLSARINTLTQSRLSAGDISQTDARVIEVDTARTAQDAARAAHDVTVADERLRLLLGLPGDPKASVAVTLATETAPLPACATTDVLLREALVARPDVRAAEIAVEAAGARLGWEKSRVLALTAVLDANGQGREGFEAGPGLDLGVPLFNRNQGGRARAAAELQRASAAYVAAQQRVASELREAAAFSDQATQSLASWRADILPALQASVADTEAARAAGDTSLLAVLEHQRRLVDARVRERELDTDVQRARARLERAAGRSCGAPPQEISREQ